MNSFCRVVSSTGTVTNLPNTTYEEQPISTSTNYTKNRRSYVVGIYSKNIQQAIQTVRIGPAGTKRMYVQNIATTTA